MARANILGFPRIGKKRELKKATEAYWQGSSSLSELLHAAREIRKTNWLLQKASGVDLIPSNDFSFYDQMLDMSCLLGNIPERFGWKGEQVPLDVQFLVARGTLAQNPETLSGKSLAAAPASEMTKWFDTNYHYIVPEFHSNSEFSLSTQKPFAEFSEALTFGIKTKPVLISPVTYLSLGKVQDSKNKNFNRFSLLPKLLPVYAEIMKELVQRGAEWIQIDEPILSTDITDEQRKCIVETYKYFQNSVPGVQIMLATYFGELRDNLNSLLSLPVAAVHIDAVRGGKEVLEVAKKLPKNVSLSVGVVDGRNIWINDLNSSLSVLSQVQDIVGTERLFVAPSCSLIHTPVTLAQEAKLEQTLPDKAIKNLLSFATEKLGEVTALKAALNGARSEALFKANTANLAVRKTSSVLNNPAVMKRMNAVDEKSLKRASGFAERQAIQRKKFNLPPFPTTTIGSFPQTTEVRNMRAQLKRGDITEAQYQSYIEQEIASSVQFQEEIGIDMLVHGEFERNDMVEYFGEQLDGFFFTQNGWVQSYGSRYVKPPVIVGDVSRPKAMTVQWSSYAQSLTKKPMKGMLTGPVTILQWSFVRNDIPRSEVTKQIALALRDEVEDLEAAGVTAIQIDEPALREGLPLRKSDWKAYLEWAVDAFRLSSSSVADGTQIHTHMCYSEFNDIIAAIAALDADVISIETSRSNMELLGAFVDFHYPNEIGPGVYDIHSPRVPTVEEMVALMKKASAVLPPENLWVNPDCGLKTRGWKEVKVALENMVQAARVLRTGLKN